MSWMPKRQRPTEPGYYWFQQADDDPEPVSIFMDEELMVADTNLAGGSAPLSHPMYGRDSRFAPAVPPPDWNLVEALRDAAFDYPPDPLHGRRDDEQVVVSLDYAEELVGAYLAGEPKP